MLDAQPHLHPTAVIDLLHAQRDLGVEQLRQALHIGQHTLLERPELLNRGLCKYGELPAVALVGGPVKVEDGLPGQDVVGVVDFGVVAGPEKSTGLMRVTRGRPGQREVMGALYVAGSGKSTG
jgi:hypothetical protein